MFEYKLFKLVEYKLLKSFMYGTLYVWDTCWREGLITNRGKDFMFHGKR